MVKGLVKRRLDHSGVHVLLPNIYASADKWDGVEKVRNGMEQKKVNKKWMGVACEYVAGDSSHLHMEPIESFSTVIGKHLRSLPIRIARINARYAEKAEAGVPNIGMFLDAAWALHFH
ncbi:hypothetical protein RJ639_042263 [Escallonia herrerae]|uniref:Uncharacterized protein n=1 Tax=Escallonia herrerae TaxID=1293975 RepID=A0AA89B7N9_9ASTE|nr:hypothetical protein RJ639_042263 [Escallonia herrerae]